MESILEKNAIQGAGPLKEMNKNILAIKELALALESQAGTFPCVQRNARRVLASVKMMELNLCDVMELGLIDPSL